MWLWLGLGWGWMSILTVGARLCTKGVTCGEGEVGWVESRAKA